MRHSLRLLTELIADQTLYGFGDRAVFLRKIVNTFLYPSFFWSWVVRDQEVDELLRGAYKEPLSRKVFRNIFWFWPRLVNEVEWSHGAVGQKKNPESFSDVHPHHCDVLKLFSDLLGDPDKRILDLGCNMGRHLNALHENGHGSLYGVDIMKSAFVEFERTFPETFSASVLEHDTFQRFLSRQGDRTFSGVYTFGATVEVVHPSFDLIKEVCRVTDELVMFVINENGGAYPRFWSYEFNKAGFDLVFTVRPWMIKDKNKSSSPLATSLLLYRRKSPQPI